MQRWCDHDHAADAQPPPLRPCKTAAMRCMGAMEYLLPVLQEPSLPMFTAGR